MAMDDIDFEKYSDVLPYLEFKSVMKSEYNPSMYIIRKLFSELWKLRMSVDYIYLKRCDVLYGSFSTSPVNGSKLLYAMVVQDRDVRDNEVVVVSKKLNLINDDSDVGYYCAAKLIFNSKGDE